MTFQGSFKGAARHVPELQPESFGAFVARIAALKEANNPVVDRDGFLQMGGCACEIGSSKDLPAYRICG